jgi:MtrB/PioB family decaheme-associated outer membrane protein
MRMTTASRYTLVAVAVASVLGSVTQAQTHDPRPDTSNWKCERCPFFEGYSASVEAGVEYANGANASYGRYSGVDHNGAYADVSAMGQWRTAGGTFGSYKLDNVGLPAREGYVDTGQEGLFNVRLAYDGQPTRLYDTAQTPYQGAGPGQLGLPSSWVPGSTTSAMTQLYAFLEPIKIGYNRRTVSLLGQFTVSSGWEVYADASHQEKAGTEVTSGSFLFDATQLPRPVDYKTNTIETGVRWTGTLGSLHLSYSGSWFRDDTNALVWSNPYTPIVTGSTQGQMAQPPGNDLQQISAGGDIHLPVFNATTLTYEASVGKLTQDQSFLPVSTLQGTPALNPGSLDGDVHMSHFALALSSRPLRRLYVRGRVAYDGRDDQTHPLLVSYIVTDTFPGGTYLTPRYGEDRTRLDGSVDYRVLHWLRLGVAGEALYTHYSPGQEVTSTQNNRGWGQVVVNPLASVSVTAKAGNARRKASIFNASALPLDENPALRAYNYAPRDQNFFSLSSSWTLTSALTWSLQGSWADDAYRLSRVGLREGRERSLSTTLSWMPIEKLSVHADGSYQRSAALQSGESGGGAPLWQVQDADYFWTLNAGGRWAIHERWDAGLDYVRSRSRGDTNTFASGTAQPFPENRTRLDSIWLSTTYHWSPALEVHLRYGHEKYATTDWALDNVGVATLGNLLGLGLQPYRHDVNVIGLTAKYEFGVDKGTKSPE